MVHRCRILGLELKLAMEDFLSLIFAWHPPNLRNEKDLWLLTRLPCVLLLCASEWIIERILYFRFFPGVLPNGLVNGCCTFFTFFPSVPSLLFIRSHL